ncbi:four helix bundle protein [candidate division KSB1 bacterium]|nr:four helix bundle protein [candidate division KSB1 bacterium]NIR70303.1 four helix bundle protein [candidate division KSB1 bacterium]NIS24464.1 four helix bundle protein [candidate division KSB1 bacterium]NIT71400.1 four helix bundle protein [candidate division KSB1 bacterium]NIU25084.1 four helix bundle protein [candidate division KSB1 bacterium]
MEDGGVYDVNRDFITLEAWQNARDVKLFFHKKVLPRLPREERYNLLSQIRRASISITANIAEGYGRFHYQEGIQFYRISRGSLYELKDHLITCLDLQYIDTKTYDEGKQLIELAQKNLNGYINYVKNKNKIE